MTENSPAYGELLDALKPIFVTCSSGTTPFTDVMVVAYRDGVRLNGHVEMTFNRVECAQLIAAIQKLTGVAG